MMCRFIVTDYNIILDTEEEMYYEAFNDKSASKLVSLLNRLVQENEDLKKEVGYWKQVASQYSNELNVKEHEKLNGWKE